MQGVIPIDQRCFKDKRILITGGLGFIGSNLARRLVDLEAQVTIIDSLIPEYGGNLFNLHGIEDKVKVHNVDVRDKTSMLGLIQSRDYLFNLAGQTSHMDSMQDPETDVDINCRSQLSILESCRKRNPHVKIVFASTRQIYGKPDYLPVDEKHPLRPTDVNGINKMAGEYYHSLYHKVYGIPACALRLTNTYGPGMRIKDSRQTFLGTWIRLLLEGRPFEVWGGNQLRDFTYIDDAVDALLLAAAREEANGKVYNLGASEVVSLLDLAGLLVAANGGGTFQTSEFPADRKPIDIGDYFADDRLIRSELGWTPKVKLQQGLSRTLDYFRRHLTKYL
jgi:UDP-glucose 4-epimerase